MLVTLIQIVGGLGVIAAIIVAVVMIIQKKQATSAEVKNARNGTAFSPTRTISGMLALDDTNKLWQILKTENSARMNCTVYRYSDIAGIELLEDDTSVPANAERTFNTANSGTMVGNLCIRIMLVNNTMVYVDFTSMRLDVTSSAYVNAYKKARQVFGALGGILQSNYPQG